MVFFSLDANKPKPDKGFRFQCNIYQRAISCHHEIIEGHLLSAFLFFNFTLLFFFPCLLFSFNDTSFELSNTLSCLEYKYLELYHLGINSSYYFVLEIFLKICITCLVFYIFYNASNKVI